MRASESLIKHNHYFILAFAFLSLMFFQSTRLFIASIYYENLTGMGISPSIGYLAVFLAPLLLIFLKKIDVDLVMTVAAVVMVIHRVYGSLDSEANLFMIFHAMVIISYGIYLPAFLTIYYDFYTKMNIHTMPWVIIIGLVLAVQMDIILRVLGHSLDITLGGLVADSGIRTWHPLWFTVPMAGITLFCIYKNYVAVKEELPEVDSPQETAEPVSTVFPGICLGLLLCVFFAFLGAPGVAVRWSSGDYTTIVLCTMSVLFLMVMLLQWAKIRRQLFHPVFQVVMNAIQLWVILDILYFDLGVAQYLLGLALGSLIMDMFIFYQTIGVSHYTIEYFIRLLAIGIITLLIVLFSSVATLVWAHIGPVGFWFQGKLIPLMTIISVIYIVSAVYYNRNIYSQLVD
ncbi:hypothetical protein WDW89_21865 [Deltaproteobacteria bacterium TL4]